MTAWRSSISRRISSFSRIRALLGSTRSSLPSLVQRGGEGSPVRRGDEGSRIEASPTELNRRDRRPEALPTELNRRDRRVEASPLSLIGDASAPSTTVELNRRRFSSVGVGICNGELKCHR